MKILDIGMGTGEATSYFCKKNLEVFATGLDPEIYGIDQAWLNEHEVSFFDTRVEELGQAFEGDIEEINCPPVSE